MENTIAITVNLDYLHKISAGDTTFEKMVLLGAVDDISAQVQNLQNAWHDKDAVLIRRIAHSLKSVVAIAGLDNLEMNCRSLEQQFMDENFNAQALVYLDAVVYEWGAAKPVLGDTIVALYGD
ncbi:MAG: Hpt domain [Bacteroidota bacterium]|jgi:HPt (histidine-containing phosphotransfer) domain-containing protein